MRKKWLGWLQYVVFLGLAFFLVWWSLGKVSDEGWKEINATLRNVNYLLVAPVVIALLVSHLSRAIRWKILMEPMGYQPNTINTFLAVLIGYLANLLVPRLGEVLKCTILARYEKIPADKLVGTIVAERAFDLICLMIVFFLTIVTQLDVIGNFASEMVRDIVSQKAGQWSLSKLLILLGIGLVVVLGVRWVLHRFAHFHLIAKVKSIFRGILEGLTSVKDVQKKGWFFFHTALIWFLYLASIRLGFLAIDATSAFGWKEALSVLSLGSIGMIVTQGGIGAYPLLVQKTMMIYGVSESVGIAFGWMLWIVQFLLVIVFGGISLILFPFINRKKIDRA
jgi:glycosyltransferase 2 family protein